MYYTVSFIYKAAISVQPLFTKIQIINYGTIGRIAVLRT